MKPLSGLYLVEPHGRLLWEGIKKLIIRSTELPHLNEPLYLLSGDRCYGIIILYYKTKLDKENFDKLIDQHRITEEEVKKWNWEDKDLFYAYEPTWVEHWEHPLKVILPQGVQTFVDSENIQWTDIKDIEIIKRGISATILPMSDKPSKFVLQSHYRGKSVHIDFRIIHPENPELLWGQTWNAQITGSIKEPVTTLEEAQKCNKDPSVWKINNEPGFGAEKQPPKVLVEPKALEPKEWFTYEGIVQPGTVGATKQNLGVFSILDTGEVEILTQKSYYLEFYLHGKRFNGLWIMRLLPNIWKLKGEEEEGRTRVTQEFVWLVWKPKNQDTPYVLLSRTAFSTRWMPPLHISCLPKALRDRVPSQYKYWEADTIPKARKVRDELVRAIKNDEVSLQRTTSFVLQRHWFKGQTVIRAGPSEEHWDIRIPMKVPGGYFHFVLNADPLRSAPVGAIWKPFPDLDWMVKGSKGAEELPPGSPGNPSKDTRAWIQITDKGTCVVITDESNFKKVLFRGNLLKGVWVFERTPKTEVWSFRPSERIGEEIERTRKSFIFPLARSR